MRSALILATMVILATPPAPAAPRRGANPVDEYFDGYWKENSIRPAGKADDYEFLRRLSLDVVGRLPKPDEIRSFAADRAADKRAKKIDALLESDEAADFWADQWMRILFNYRFEQVDPFKIHFPAFGGWLKKAVKDDMPYNEFVTHLLADRGDYKKLPATNYILKHLDAKEPPYEIAARATRVFLGFQMQCARCHDHPVDKWTQEDFWGITAFFSGVKSKNRTTFEGTSIKLFDEGATKIRIPDSTVEVSPHFLDGRVPDDPGHAGEALAKFYIGYKDNQFAKALVNRMWAHYTGRGFVEPLDRFMDRAKPKHPALMERLATDFVKEGYSLRKLYRTILNSKVYQAESNSSGNASKDSYTWMELKPQNPVQLLNTLTYTLNLDVFLKEFYKTFYNNKDLPETYRNEEVFRMYLHLFMQGLLAPSGQVPEESKYTGSTRLALRLMNNNDLQGLIKAEWGRLGEIMKGDKPPGGKLEEIFLTLLSRPPTSTERTAYVQYIEQKKGAKGAYEDIYWTLLNSTEFFFNH